MEPLAFTGRQPAWFDLDVDRTGFLISWHPACQAAVAPILAKREPQLILPLSDLPAATKLLTAMPSSMPGWQAAYCRLPQLVVGEAIDQDLGYEAACALRDLFSALRLAPADLPTETGRYQLLTIDGFDAEKCTGGHGEGGIWMSGGYQFRQFLNSLGSDSLILPVGDMMAEVHGHLINNAGYDVSGDEYHVYMDKKYRLHMELPFDIYATQLGVESDNDFGEEAGFWAMSHNTGGCLRQFVLLAGIAKLHQMARAEGY